MNPPTGAVLAFFVGLSANLITAEVSLASAVSRPLQAPPIIDAYSDSVRAIIQKSSCSVFRITTAKIERAEKVRLPPRSPLTRLTLLGSQTIRPAHLLAWEEVLESAPES